MLDVKGDKTLWERTNLEDVGNVLLVEESYYDGIIQDIEQLSWAKNLLQEENDSLCEKLADIRDLFDQSDEKAEGHGMEDAISSPYAVACYAENKLKRQQKEIEELKHDLTKYVLLYANARGLLKMD